MEHAALLTAFGEKIGLECGLDGEGLAVLDMGDGLLVYVESRDGEQEGVLLMQVGVGRLGDNPSPDLVKGFLAANLFYQGRSDIVAALDPTADELVLLCALDEPRCTLEAFEEALEALVNEAGQWRDLIKASYEEPAGEPQSAAPAAPAVDTRLFTPGTFV